MNTNITYELVPAKDGSITASVLINDKKQFLHSKLYPSKESKQYADKFMPENQDALID